MAALATQTGAKDCHCSKSLVLRLNWLERQQANSSILCLAVSVR